MSLLGRVFTYVILVLSVVFFSIAVAVNSTHIDNKRQADQYRTQAENAQRENRQLQDNLERVRRELAIEQAARRMALAALQTQLSQNVEELEQKERDLRQLQSTLTELTAEEKQTIVQLRSRSEENERLRDQIRVARQDRDQLFQNLVQTKKELVEQQGMLTNLRERYSQLNEVNNLATSQLQVLGIKPDTLLDAPPAVQGQVLAVAANGLVEVSLGRDDGIRQGFTLDVHRSGQYLGRVKVVTVEDNKAVAEVLTSYQKGYIQPGDRVASKLL